VSVSDILFLTLEDVLILHEMQIEAYGGSPGIRDRGLLESAIYQPQASFGGDFVHQGIFEMAAAYAFHIAENQPFIDGNKRCALAAALVFLDWHHIEIDDEGEQLYQAMIDMAEKKIDKYTLSQLFQRLSRQVSP
jgi:death-on-curing protein